MKWLKEKLFSFVEWLERKTIPQTSFDMLNKTLGELTEELEKSIERIAELQDENNKLKEQIRQQKKRIYSRKRTK